MSHVLIHLLITWLVSQLLTLVRRRSRDLLPLFLSLLLLWSLFWFQGHLIPSSCCQEEDRFRVTNYAQLTLANLTPFQLIHLLPTRTTSPVSFKEQRRPVESQEDEDDHWQWQQRHRQLPLFSWRQNAFLFFFAWSLLWRDHLICWSSSLFVSSYFLLLCYISDNTRQSFLLTCVDEVSFLSSSMESFLHGFQFQ